ncbi:MAG TPA: cupin domain-containing protein, partial [Solirubrobacteraceae bacterium]|nr:cupin domain-containing protein [Solirubrobacteraceae bacterium]
LQPGQGHRIHRHQRQEEVYIVLEGELTLTIEGSEEHVVEPGSVVRVAPDLRRQLVNKGSERLLMVAIGGAEEHNGRDAEAFLSWEDTEPRSPADVPFPDDV